MEAWIRALRPLDAASLVIGVEAIGFAARAAYVAGAALNFGGDPAGCDVIKRANQAFLDTLGMRDDLRIVQKNLPGTPAAAAGTPFGKDAVVLVSPNFRSTDLEAFQFVFRHEVGHIHHADGVRIPLVGLALSLAALVYVRWQRPAKAGLFVCAGIPSASIPPYTTWREAKADDIAVKHSSVAQLKGGLRIWRACQLVNGTENGENIADIFHPSIASRMAKIERELGHRGVLVDPSEYAASHPRVVALRDAMREGSKGR